MDRSEVIERLEVLLEIAEGFEKFEKKKNASAYHFCEKVKKFFNEYLKESRICGRICRLCERTRFSGNSLRLDLSETIVEQKFLIELGDTTVLSRVEQQALPAATRKKYDVFISHASRDKEEYVDELNEEIKKLGVNIFYDSDVIKWGDNWKEAILAGIEQAEFAIIVISENFFGREWTEKELNDFLTRQNESGQTIVLPILHNVSVQQMKEKYPKLSEIQAIDADSYGSAESIAVLFAERLIERLR